MCVNNSGVEHLLALGKHYTATQVCKEFVQLKNSQAIFHPGRFVKVSFSTEMKLPEDSAARKLLPITSGVLDYFPEAVAAVAWCSKVGNDQHNPGQPLHWAKGKSADHADCIGRHLIDRNAADSDEVPHAVKLAWRGLALLQTMFDDGKLKFENGKVVMNARES